MESKRSESPGAADRPSAPTQQSGLLLKGGRAQWQGDLWVNRLFGPLHFLPPPLPLPRTPPVGIRTPVYALNEV